MAGAPLWYSAITAAIVLSNLVLAAVLGRVVLKAQAAADRAHASAVSALEARKQAHLSAQQAAAHHINTIAVARRLRADGGGDEPAY